MGAILELLIFAAVLVCGSQARRELSVCCGRAGTGAEYKERCCGANWGLHCCSDLQCCLGNQVVHRPSSQPQRDSVWEFKHWAQWLNITIVILVIALVTAVLVCCCRKSRREGRLLDEELYKCSYGTVPGVNPTAPQWYQQGMTSQWIPFSQKPHAQAPPQYPRPGVVAATSYPNTRVSHFFQQPV